MEPSSKPIRNSPYQSDHCPVFKSRLSERSITRICKAAANRPATLNYMDGLPPEISITD